MYTAHFGLARNPFQPISSVPPPFPSRQLQEVLAHFQYVRQHRESFFLLVGEVGTGKSTAVRAILDAVEPGTPVAVLKHTSLDPREFLEEVLRRFWLDPPGARSKPELIARLEQFLVSATERAPAVLIIDEAHLLSPATLEEVRLLSNLKQGDRPLLQICLVGQPELIERLRQHRLRPLRQRIGVRYVFGGLTWEETREYIRYRLRAAGAADPAGIFSDAAAGTVHELTAGLPREINVVADQAMLNAFLESSPVVKPRHVRTTTHDYGFEGLHGEPLRERADREESPMPARVKTETSVDVWLRERQAARERPSPDLPLELLQGPDFMAEPSGYWARAAIAAVATVILGAIVFAYRLYPREDSIEASIPEPPTSSAMVASTPDDPSLLSPAPELSTRAASSETVPESNAAETANVDIAPAEEPLALLERMAPGKAQRVSAAGFSLLPTPPSPAAQAADRLELGAYLARSGQLDDAIEAFREALALRPGYPVALYNLGVSLLAKGRLREAVEALREATSTSPDDVLAQRSLGIALHQSGELTNAAAVLRRVVELSPNDELALRHLASVLRESGEMTASIETTRRALALKPDDAGLHQELGFTLRAAGRLPEATTEFQKAIDLDGKLALAHYSLGVTLLDLGDRDAGERAIAEARRLGYAPP